MRCRLQALPSLLVLFSFTVVASPTARSQPSSLHALTASQDDSGVRAVVERYFALFASEDLDGVMGLWSEKSPTYGSAKQSLQQQFAAEDFTINDLVSFRLLVDGDQAGLRVVANQTAISRKTKETREQRIAHNFALVREAGVGGRSGVWPPHKMIW